MSLLRDWLRICLIPLALVLVAGNLFPPRAWMRHVVPVGVSVAGLRLRVLSADDEPVTTVARGDRMRLLIDSEHVRDAGEVGSDVLLGSSSIAISIRRIDATDEVEYHEVYAAKDVWRPAPLVWPQPRQGQGSRGVEGGTARFIIEFPLQLPPGSYSVRATMYADPPDGAGIDGHDVDPPVVRLSRSRMNGWVRTESTAPVSITITE